MANVLFLVVFIIKIAMITKLIMMRRILVDHIF